MGKTFGNGPGTGQHGPGAEYPAGKALYEERMKLLPGLWMQPAPPWEDLPESTRERWQRTAEESGTGD